MAMKPVHYYFFGVGGWFLAYGLQTVVFAWLVTMVLHESAERVGMAQMAYLLPSLSFVLLGGSLADRFGGRRIAIAGHILGAMAPLYLSLVLLLDALSYSHVIVSAVIMGTAQAFIAPAREGLLPLVAKGRIQQLVIKASVTQFAIQMLGFVIASFADTLGALAMLMLQFFALTIGLLAYFRLRVEENISHEAVGGLIMHIGRSLSESYQTIRASRYLTVIALQNVAMGTLFMGAWMVTIPLLVRDVYQGSSAELAATNSVNVAGLMVMVMVLMRAGDIHRQGRAMLIAQFTGSLCIIFVGFELGFPSLLAGMFCWGLAGGITIPMSRAIMQELAPVAQRGRIMAFYNVTFVGAGPLGAFINGYMVAWLGPGMSLIVSGATMIVVVITIGLVSPLWSVNRHRMADEAQSISQRL